MRIGWLSDIHLNFVAPRHRQAFYDTVRREAPDALLIGGDIGEADSVVRFLSEIERAFDVPVYFVLGNHDFYGGSIAEVRRLVAAETANSSVLHWLPATGVVEVTPKTALIGHDSWADGRLGDFFRSGVRLNDYVHIRELTGLTTSELHRKLNQLGDEAAEFLEARAKEALDTGRDVLVLTHVPPFREACWHEGQISGNEWLPHFACRAVGEHLARLMCEYPDRTMTILCGHTHSSGFVQIQDNLAVHTGGAEYGTPKLQKVLDLC